MRITSGWNLAIGLGCALGCTAPAATTEDLRPESSIGALVVERRATAIDLRTATFRAAFAEYRGIEESDVLTLLGDRASADMESCGYFGDDDTMELNLAEVELLDVGTIRVSAAGSEARLVPHAFPDLASVIAGVFYAGDATFDVPLAEVREYGFRATGSDDLPPFELLVPAPSDIEGISLGVQPLSELQVIGRERDLDVTWAAGDVADAIEIEFRVLGESVVCIGRDDGHLQVSREALGTLPASARADVMVRRVRVTAVDVPGLLEAFARIAVIHSGTAILQ